jgi:hypothetical protein
MAENNQKQFTDITNLLGKTLDIFTKGIETFLILMGIVMGVTFGVIVLFIVVIFIAIAGFILLVELIPIDNEFVLGILLVFAYVFFILLYIIFITFLPTLGQAALIKATDDIAKNQKKTIKDYFQFVWNIKWKIWGLYLLSILLTMIGFIFLIIPGIIIGFCMMFAPYLLILENKKITECIKESFILVKDNFMSTLWKHILVFFAFVIIVMFSSFMPLANMVISFLSGIFTIIYVYLIYKDIRKVKNNVVYK